MKKHDRFSCVELTHGIATAFAICGLGLIIVAPLDYAIYGIALFGLAIALCVIAATQCHDNAKHRGPVSHW